MASPEDEEKKRIEDVLAYPILLSERVRSAADHAVSFRFECSELRKHLDRLSPLLRSLARFTAATPSLYDRPIRRVLADVSRRLERALALARKCRRRSVIRRLFTITSGADFRKVLGLLEASIADARWLLSIFGAEGGDGGGIELSLPPIAANDPILSWVWAFIASIHTRELPDRIEAANELASLSEVNDRNKKIIAEEGGVPPLLKLLKDGSSVIQARIAAATALHSLANDRDRVRLIVNENGVPVIVQVLRDEPIEVRIPMAMLLSRMAEHDSVAQEHFSREDAIRPLVSLLSMEILRDENQFATSSCHIQLQLKTSCARALWMLARGNVSNSRRITETKGLLCLAKMVEKESGELQYSSLMAIMEITAAAKMNVDIRQAAFKTNSPAAKAVVDQLLRVIKEIHSPSLRIPAIRSIGSLSRTFPARETRVIVPLVAQLGHRDPDVACEAAISLAKFACLDNFLRAEHSKTIIELNGVQSVMKRLRGNDQTQFHGLVLLCYLALHSSPSESLEQARVLTALEGADRSVAAHHPELMELILTAIYHLKTYAVNPQIPSYPP